MALEDALTTVLAADPGVSPLVAARIFPGVVADNPAYPYISHHVISETTASAMGADVGCLRRRVQVDCFGETATSARTVALAVAAALTRFRGTVNYTGGSTVIEDIYRLGVNDNFDFAARKFKRSVDFDVVFDG